MNSSEVIKSLFDFSEKIRYVAIYKQGQLTYRQRDSDLEGASSGDTDRFEELLVNPTLLKLATQRGEIDCGGLDHLLIGYGNFYQLVKATVNGHISICLDQTADLNQLPAAIFSHLAGSFADEGLIWKAQLGAVDQ